jgi:hypothetical protein
VAAVAVVDVPAGAGLVVAGALAAAAVAVQRRRAWTPAELGLAGLALTLLLVAGVRDAEWLVALCVLAAAGLGALAVSSARTWAATLLTPAAVPVASVRALPWVARGASAEDGGVRRWVSVLRTAVLTAALLGVFGALLASADAAFARLVELVLPTCGWASCPLGGSRRCRRGARARGRRTSPSPRRPGRARSCRPGGPRDGRSGSSPSLRSTCCCWPS